MPTFLCSLHVRLNSLWFSFTQWISIILFLPCMPVLSDMPVLFSLLWKRAPRIRCKSLGLSDGNLIWIFLRTFNHVIKLCLNHSLDLLKHKKTISIIKIVLPYLEYKYPNKSHREKCVWEMLIRSFLSWICRTKIG